MQAYTWRFGQRSMPASRNLVAASAAHEIVSTRHSRRKGLAPSEVWSGVVQKLGWAPGSPSAFVHEQEGRHGQPVWTTDPSTLSPYVCLALEVQDVEGSGKGLIATQDIHLGQLLLVCRPLDIVTGLAGTTPQPAQLASALSRTATQLLQPIIATSPPNTIPQPTSSSHASASADIASGTLGKRARNLGHDTTASQASADMQWLHAFFQLHGGPAENLSWLPSTVTNPDTAQQGSTAGLLQQLASVSTPTTTISSSLQPSTGIDVPLTALHPQEMQPDTSSPPQHWPPPKWFQQRVHDAATRRAQLNGYGEPHQDVILATCGTATHQVQEGQTQYCSMLGVWPAMALINHACCPNACTMLVGDWMLVRAAVDIQAGEQVSISYAGIHAGSPVSVRRHALRQGFGFRCDCWRCLVEQDYEDEKVGQMAKSLHTELQGKLRPALLTALDTDDTQAVQRVVKKLETRLNEYQAAINEVKEQEDREILRCAVTPMCLELLSLAASVTGVAPGRQPNNALKSSSSGFGGFGKPSTRSKPSNTPTAHDSAAQGSIALLQQRSHLLRSIAPGSYPEAQLSARLLLANYRLLGVAHTETREAHERCVAVHTARYGQLDGPASTAAGAAEVSLMVRVLTAHEDNTLADDLAQAAVKRLL